MISLTITALKKLIDWIKYIYIWITVLKKTHGMLAKYYYSIQLPWLKTEH